MPDISRILSAKTPLTLASLARGAQPLVMADLARAATGRAVFVAPDEAAMQAVADAARWFAPEIEVVEFPAWDCLPYDRASPALSVSARRLAALHRLQAGNRGKQLLVTTVNALTQRVLTPFRVRESVRELKPGVSIGHESLAALLQRQGYSRTDTVIDSGRIRRARLDLRHLSIGAGSGPAARLLRRRAGKPAAVRSRHPAHHRSGRPPPAASRRARLCSTRDSIKLFRGRYREMFGA